MQLESRLRNERIHSCQHFLLMLFPELVPFSVRIAEKEDKHAIHTLKMLNPSCAIIRIILAETIVSEDNVFNDCAKGQQLRTAAPASGTLQHH
jgi:hypothetical protein